MGSSRTLWSGASVTFPSEKWPLQDKRERLVSTASAPIRLTTSRVVGIFRGFWWLTTHLKLWSLTGMIYQCLQVICWPQLLYKLSDFEVKAHLVSTCCPDLCGVKCSELISVIHDWWWRGGIILQFQVIVVFCFFCIHKQTFFVADSATFLASNSVPRTLFSLFISYGKTSYFRVWIITLFIL